MPSATQGGEDPDAAAVSQPRQRGHLGRGDGALPAAPRRGGRRLHPHRDRGGAAHRAGRRGRRRALGRQGPRQGRPAAAQLRAGHRRQGQVHGARRGLLGASDRRRDPRVRPGRGARAAGLGARRQGGLEGPQAAGSADPHDRPVAAEAQVEVRPDRRDVAVPDEGREDRRRPRLDRLRRGPRVRRRDDLRPRPAAAVQAAPARARDPRGRRARLLGREGAAGRRLVVDAEADDAGRAARRRLRGHGRHGRAEGRAPLGDVRQARGRGDLRVA